jgi:hypothetical protein
LNFLLNHFEIILIQQLPNEEKNNEKTPLALFELKKVYAKVIIENDGYDISTDIGIGIIQLRESTLQFEKQARDQT